MTINQEAVQVLSQSAGILFLTMGTVTSLLGGAFLIDAIEFSPENKRVQVKKGRLFLAIGLPFIIIGILLTVIIW